MYGIRVNDIIYKSLSMKFNDKYYFISNNLEHHKYQGGYKFLP